MWLTQAPPTAGSPFNRALELVIRETARALKLGGLFAVYSYIAPMVTELADRAVWEMLQGSCIDHEAHESRNILATKHTWS